VAGLCIIVLIAVLIVLNKGGRPDGVPLDEATAVTLEVGGKCHFIEEEKQSIPYRWSYTISEF